jgi:hypothetical protein
MQRLSHLGYEGREFLAEQAFKENKLEELAERTSEFEFFGRVRRLSQDKKIEQIEIHPPQHRNLDIQIWPIRIILGKDVRILLNRYGFQTPSKVRRFTDHPNSLQDPISGIAYSYESEQGDLFYNLKFMGVQKR